MADLGSSPGTKPISEREKALLACPTIASQMPVIFGNGAEWSELTGICSFCKKIIPDDLLRGSVVRQLPSVAVVDAVGVCPDCRMATPFLYRMYDDMRLTGPRGGKWHTWKSPPSFMERIRSWLSMLVTGKKG